VKSRVLRIPAAFALFALGTVISCGGPLEPPPSAGPLPWERYEVRGLPARNAVNDVYMLSATEGWAVAEGPYFLYFDGVEWAVRADLSSAYPDVDITRISFSTPDDGWAVGHKFLGSGDYEAYVFHYDGRRWTRLSGILSELGYYFPAYDVEALSPDDVWLVGGYSILHFDGTTWSNYRVGITVTALSFSSAAAGWAIGYHGSYRWNGTTWEINYSPCGGANDVASPTRATAWAVGGFSGGGEIPAGYEISRWREEKGEWESYQGGRFKDPYFYLTGVHFAAANDGWAVGDYIVIRYDGKEWREIAVPEEGANNVFTLGANDVWVAGYGCLNKYSPFEE